MLKLRRDQPALERAFLRAGYEFDAVQLHYIVQLVLRVVQRERRKRRARRHREEQQ